MSTTTSHLIPSPTDHQSKMAKIMVNAWETIKKIPSLFDFCGSRSLDICDFIGSMETFSDFAQDIIDDAKTKSSVLKSVKLPINKSKRAYLQNGGEKPNQNRFPHCINCLHHLIDLPPMNKETKLQNQAKTNRHLKLTDELQAFKSGISDKPPFGDDLRPLNKIPPPNIKPLIITCKCRNNKRENCVVRCFYNGKQFAFGKCPLCTCWCNHACTFENYFQGNA